MNDHATDAHLTCQQEEHKKEDVRMMKGFDDLLLKVLFYMAKGMSFKIQFNHWALEVISFDFPLSRIVSIPM